MDSIRGRVGHIRGHLIGLFMFFAWLAAARGWLLLVAPVWLGYSAWIAYKWRRWKVRQADDREMD